MLFKAQEQKELTSKQWGIVESLLQSLEQVEVEIESLVWKDFLCKLWQTVEQKARIEPKDKEILSKVSESEAQKWQQQRTAEYKTWLQGAASGYLRRCFDRLKNRNRPWSDHLESCL